jgi:hypothetical protein
MVLKLVEAIKAEDWGWEDTDLIRPAVEEAEKLINELATDKKEN